MSIKCGGTKLSNKRRWRKFPLSRFGSSHYFTFQGLPCQKFRENSYRTFRVAPLTGKQKNEKNGEGHMRTKGGQGPAPLESRPDDYLSQRRKNIQHRQHVHAICCQERLYWVLKIIETLRAVSAPLRSPMAELTTLPKQPNRWVTPAVRLQPRF